MTPIRMNRWCRNTRVQLMHHEDPNFWRAGAISTTVVMAIVLGMLTIDSLEAIAPGGSHVPPYTVINRHIGYAYNAKLGRDMPIVGEPEPLFGKSVTDSEAAALIAQGKLVIQSRACIMGNGSYYAPDLTKAWLDPAWEAWTAITGAENREEAMARFLMAPDQYATWQRRMPNLGISRDEAVATVAYLKWLSSIDTNGFPIHFGRIKVSE
jgi:nitric oxide reductase subunit C